MIWSMSSIAASKHPDALKRFCKVLLASASIPVLFPPVLFDVHANGEKHNEMHIYSGMTSQVLLYPAAFRFQSLTDTAAAKRRREIFILRNGRLGPNHEPIERQLLPVAVRSISTLAKSHGMNDLHRIFVSSKRDRLDFNLAVTPHSFREPTPEPCDPAYTHAVFEVGFAHAKNDYNQAKVPPGFEPPEPLH